MLDAIAKAPADIAELSLSFSAAPAIKKAVLALLSRVRDRVQHLAVKRVHEDMSCGGIFGQSWALDMEAEEVKAFWRLVEECAATKLTLGSEGKDTWLVRKGAYNFRWVARGSSYCRVHATGLTKQTYLLTFYLRDTPLLHSAGRGSYAA